MQNKETNISNPPSEIGENYLFRRFLNSLFSRKKKKTIGFIPKAKPSPLTEFPEIDPSVAEKSGFRFYRSLGKDLFQAVSFAFIEVCIRNRDHLTFKNFKENKDTYFLFAKIPEGMSLKHEKDSIQDYKRSFHEFGSWADQCVKKLLDPLNDNYTNIEDFYKELESSDMTLCFKILLRGYILGRILKEPGRWEHYRKKDDFSKTFKNFSNLKAYERKYMFRDLVLITSFIIDHIAIYMFAKTEKGQTLKLEYSSPPESSFFSNLPEKQEINLLYAMEEFHLLYSDSLVKCRNCREERDSSIIIPCTNHKPHFLCRVCLEKLDFPQKCDHFDCDANLEEEVWKRNVEIIEKKRNICKCPNCNAKLVLSEKSYECPKCHEEKCKKHLENYTKCYCFCCFCQEDTEKVGSLFPHQKICKTKDCGGYFCTACGFQGKNEMFCHCFCGFCGSRVAKEEACRGCERSCSVCGIKFEERWHEVPLKSCKGCPRRFCGYCELADFVGHQKYWRQGFCPLCTMD